MIIDGGDQEVRRLHSMAAAFYYTKQIKQKQSKAKQRCVMGVGMCLYAQLVQTKNK